MANGKRVPPRLYKYREFSNRTLDILVADNLHFADPSTFNDPLDTKPCLNPDINAAALEDVLRQMVQQRVSAEMTAAAKAIKYRGPRTMAQIERLSQQRAEHVIAEAHDNASDPTYEDDDGALEFLLAREVEQELLRRYDKGIVSLATGETCPLMWSHYADQHKGVCIGYSVPDDAVSSVHKINYGGSRLIEASAIPAMLSGDAAAQRRVDEAFLTRKARAWRYEREWRLIGNRGLHGSPLELEEIIFGLRCADPVRFAIVSALQNRSRPVTFYEIREQPGQFLLRKCALDTGELTANFPRRYRGVFEHFQPVVHQLEHADA